jgi:hypothetical protein
MADTWSETTLEQVQVGDRVRFRGSEFTVARVDERFLGRDSMVCLIEDTPDQWRAFPGQLTDALERRDA